MVRRIKGLNIELALQYVMPALRPGPFKDSICRKRPKTIGGVKGESGQRNEGRGDETGLQEGKPRGQREVRGEEAGGLNDKARGFQAEGASSGPQISTVYPLKRPTHAHPAGSPECKPNSPIKEMADAA